MLTMIDYKGADNYNAHMIIIKRMPQFDAWFAGIKDDMTRRRLLMRLRKVSLGNLGILLMLVLIYICEWSEKP